MSTDVAPASNLTDPSPSVPADDGSPPTRRAAVAVQFRRLARAIRDGDDAMVESATANRPNAILNLAQPSPAPIPLGSLVCNRSAVAQLTISNCHFLGNRARGVVAHSNARIEDNSFSGCSLAAILFGQT